MKTLAALFVALLCLAGSLARPQSQEGIRLLKTSEHDPGTWVDESEVLQFKKTHGNFMDITNKRAVTNSKPLDTAFPTAVRYRDIVAQAISHVSTPRTQEFLDQFSSYHNRYYTTDDGKNSALFIASTLNETIAASSYKGQVSVKEYYHDWKQPSIIARIEGSDPALKKEIVILGAHLDSVSSGASGKAPGADDNGSGSSVLMEAFRAILDSDFIPKRSIEFQWYAAEEVGLRGSQDIAADYYVRELNIVSMVNFDVVGYNEGSTTIGIINDYTSPSLSSFIKLVIDEYLDFTWIDRTCGYACSDHASFDEARVDAAFPIENGSHPDVHTPYDTIDKVDFVQVKEFTKLALGYAIEIAEPSVPAS